MKLKLVIFCLLLNACSIAAHAQQSKNVTAKGAHYQVINPKQGERIKLNDVITFNLSIKTKKDSLLMSSYQRGRPFTTQVQPSQSIDDLMDVFTQLTDKDSARVAIPVDSLFKNREADKPAFLGIKDSVIYLLKIEKVQTLEQAIAERNAAQAKALQEQEGLKTAEAAKLAGYVSALNPKPVKTASGMYYQVLKSSALAKPLPGDTLLVNYTGRTLDGKVFDTSVKADAEQAGVMQPGRPYEPFQFVVKAGQVIPGWDEGFLLLHKGEKARLIIPSALAYGGNQSGPNIPPYSTLVFDVELIAIKAAKHPKPVAKLPVKRYYPKKPVKKKAAAKKM